jgi:phosphoribosylformylglycinamidine synthase PurS subunit
MWKAKIFITLKESVLDPQGEAVKGSLHTLGFTGVESVRIGKQIEVLLEAKDREQAETDVKAMSEKLLANTVVENFRYELEEVKA